MIELESSVNNGIITLLIDFSINSCVKKQIINIFTPKLKEL